MLVRLGALAALAAAPLALAQTYTDCNPLNKDCPADAGLSTSSYSADFTQGASAGKGWTPASGTTINYGAKGAEFTITAAGQAPTWESDFHILFGTLEVTMQAATGVGIVSSIVLESSDLDEIDWEFLGGDTTQAQSNYFGKGDTTTYDRGAYHPVSAPQSTMHTYKIDWSPDRFIYSIDGTAVRTVTYAQAQGGTRYPQTPMKVKLGSWAGGGPGSPPGTVEWAGGATDFKASPFTMYVQSVKITNTYPASEYVWTDRSGNWQSIKAVGGKAQPVNDAVSSSSAPTSTAVSPSSTTATAKTTQAPKSSLTASTTNSTTTTKKPSSTQSTTKSAGNSTTAKIETTQKPVARPVVNATATTTTLITSKQTNTAASTAAQTGSGGNGTSASTSSSQGKTSGAASGGPAVTGMLLCIALVASLGTL